MNIFPFSFKITFEQQKCTLLCQEESALPDLCQIKLPVINKICVVGQQGVSGNCPTAMEEEREVCAVCMRTGILNLETMGGGKEEDSWRKRETGHAERWCDG